MRRPPLCCNLVDGCLQGRLMTIFDHASEKPARLVLAAALACAVALPLVTNPAMAAEVKRNGAFLQKQCGGSSQGTGPGCAWCTSNSCYIVSDCSGKTCTIVRTGPNPNIAGVPQGPVNKE